jgi:hypothetical protein
LEVQSIARGAATSNDEESGSARPARNSAPEKNAREHIAYDISLFDDDEAGTDLASSAED